MLLSAYSHGTVFATAFIVSFYVCLIGAKIVLAILVNAYQGFFSGNTYAILMKVIGLVLLVFAGMLFKEGFDLLLNESR